MKDTPASKQLRESESDDEEVQSLPKPAVVPDKFHSAGAQLIVHGRVHTVHLPLALAESPALKKKTLF
jgi:hypothetical protein